MSLKITDLEKIHPGGRRLFGGMTIEFAENEFTVIVGPSGCGKSSLLRMIAGLDQPTRGTVQKSAPELGFVFQEPRLLPWRNVRENLELPFELRREPIPPAALSETLRLVRLPATVLDLFPHQLSGGMKMRVALARALLRSPPLLLMDEPLAALDESTRQILQEEISRIHDLQKRQTLFVTHSLSEALFLADRILILGPDGRLQKSLAVPFARPRIESLRADPEFNQSLANLQREFRHGLAERELAQ